MLEFFIMFTLAGFILGYVVEENSKVIGIIVVVSILWFFVSGFWAIATFGELLLGFSLQRKIALQDK